MCGIFGYRGRRSPVEQCLNGLQRLAYRGYDSAGIAGVTSGGQGLRFCKEVGKLEMLQKAMQALDWELSIALAHTRWATHGKPTQANAHPHTDQHRTLALVHNGIIENHHLLRQELQAQGVRFDTETDTEVVAQLVAHFYRGDLHQAIEQALQRLEGSWAFVFLHQDYPEHFVVSARNCPLMIARNEEEVMIASDLGAFEGEQLDVLFLQDDEVALVSVEEVKIFDRSGQQVAPQWQPLTVQCEAVGKGQFDHFMLKEIFEQPNTLAATLEGRLHRDALMSELPAFLLDFIKQCSQVLVIACGTSYHAGMIAANLIQELAHVPARAQIASEFHTQLPVVSRSTLVIAVSQSGETADTLSAVREAKLRGATVLALCNVGHAILTRLADATLLLRAGPEVSVCSTKAFTSQVALLTLVAVWIARARLTCTDVGQALIEELAQMPGHLAAILQQSPLLQKLAKKYAVYDHFFYIGRSYMYPASLEAALKLKEIAYIDANGYPAGELKHGPIALLTETMPVMAFCANHQTLEKMCSSLMEARARSAPLIAFAFYGCNQIQKSVDDLFWVPQSSDALAPLTISVAAQLFAYFIACERGAEIDQPRNLAKSVTVE